jgi:hypothetical protein
VVGVESEVLTIERDHRVKPSRQGTVAAATLRKASGRILPPPMHRDPAYHLEITN